jgi:cellulose synthase/poly-beta-1,6-N-acetylglucosamine synthase-like glycosyltransferase/Flp pilus assembly protein TadD
MQRVAQLILGSLLPLSLISGILIPPARPLDWIMMPFQTFFVGLFLYHLGLIVLGARRPVSPQPPRAASALRFAVLIAAHNEEAVISQLIGSIREQDYPSGLFRIFVVADHCADDTANVARSAGAIVYEQVRAERRGKGPAIDWLLQRIWAREESYDAALLFDADNLVAPDFLRKIAVYLQRGDQIVQGYLGTKNPNDSWITRAIFASYAFTNRFFQLPKEQLGLSSSLGGTGLCIAMPLLQRLGWRCESLTEDLEFQVRAILEGIRPSWAWDAIVYDEKPLSFRPAFRQRLRWMQGHCSNAFRYLGPLTRRAIASRDPVAWDAAIYLASPIWLTVALWMSGLFLSNWHFEYFTYLHPNWFPPVIMVMALAYPFIALRLEGTRTNLSTTPSTLAGVLALGICWPLLAFLGILRHRQRFWVKTTHTRTLSITETDLQHNALNARPLWVGLGPVRAVSGAVIALIFVMAVAPQLTARWAQPDVERGARLLLIGQTDSAITHLNGVIEERPDDPVALAYLALAYRVRGDTRNALRTFWRVRQLDPQLGDTAVDVVGFFHRYRDHLNARRLQHTLLSSVRSGPEAYVWMANQFIARHRFQEGEFVVQEGLDRFGPQVPLLKVNGYLHFAQNRYFEAAAVLENALRKAPEDLEVLINLGWAYVRLRRYDAAIRLWDRALRKVPGSSALQRDLDSVKALSRSQP